MKRIQLENRTDLKKEIPLSTPYCIFIDPSSACNFKCVFCMNKNIKHPTTMPFHIYRNIIDDLKGFPNPVKTIRLYGFGEPLFNRHFCDMVKYAKDSDKVLNVDTTTNGSLLNSKCIKNIIESGIDRINISIEAMSDEGYKAITGKSVNFKSIISSIAELYAAKKHTTIFVKINGDYLSPEEQIKFKATFKPISDGCDIEHTMGCWRDTTVNANNTVGIYGQPLQNVQVCPYVFYSFQIHADGDVSACFLDWNKKLIIGNVRETSLIELWNIHMQVLQLAMLHKQRNKIKACRNCQQLVAGMPVDLDNDTTDILNRWWEE